MPVDLASRFKRLLKEIISISSGIRDSALDHADSDLNFDISERLRYQLETIRTSADAILQAFARASLTSYSLDDRMTDWLASGEPHTCLSKLKEMNDVLRPIDYTEDPTPSLTPAEDQLPAAMALFDNNKCLFHFLLTPDVWNHERLGHLQSEATGIGTLPNVTVVMHEDEPLSAQAKKIDRKKGLLHQKLGEISRWLSPMECTQKHKEALRLRQEGTCKWFPNTSVYEKWRAPGNHFLWLHGKGGCGKSVLMAYTIDHLKIGLEEEEVVVFFYCDFQNKRSTSSTELMRSLLSQLLRHIRDHALDPGDFPDKVLQQKSEGMLSLDDLGKLCDLVSRAASFFRYEPMVVIDALDECADVETLLPALVTLSQSTVRLLVTSRPDQTIMDHFAGLQSLSFENVTEEIAADIALHVRRELDSHNHLRSAVSELKNEIDARLIWKAEGRFRWVQCQLDTLKRCTTKEELREALDSLPNELGATYERILEAIDERKSGGKLARRVLALLMAALEPLQVAQIVDGLSMDFQEQRHNHETQQWLETKLLPSLSSLVSYDEETDILALSHYSVKEYLTSPSALPMYKIAFHEAHAETVQMCMGYISVYLKREFSRCNLECFPMVFYVLSSGFNHLAYVDSESPIALEALRSLGSDVQHHPSHWDRLCELREESLEWPFSPWPSSKHDIVLYILIAYSLPGLLRTFLSKGRSLQPRIRTNPLVYAADLRKTEHAMVLLAHGADVNLRGLVIDDSYRASPLEVAIDLGDDLLVEELLKRGCLMTSETLSTAVCMPWCTTRVLAKLMQTDEFAEWALEIGEEKLYRSVFNSARPSCGDSMKTDEDHVVLARRLCQLGLEFSAESQFGRELLERALHAAHISMLEFLLPPDEPPPVEFLIEASTGDTSETVPVVRLLLKKGVDVCAVSGRDTVLHLAATCPWEPRSLELTRLLLDAGCDPHALDSKGETSLVVAVRHGHCSVVELLLSCKVTLPSDILHAALERRQNSHMIEFLLHRGANVHAVTRLTEATLLHRAINIELEMLEMGDWDEPEEHDDEREESDCCDLVKHFLKAGCDPTKRDSAGKTALETAIEHHFISVVELLVSSNSPLPSDILLVAIQQYSSPGMLECLIYGGADVCSTASSGDTVLHVILSEYHNHEETCYRLVKKLINAGCDTTVRNSTGELALDVAVQHGLTLVVEALLSPDAPPPPDMLMAAVRHSDLNMVEYLIRRGTDVCSSTRDGDTALHLAINQTHSEGMCYKIVKRLLNAGCNTAACNSAGKTVLDIAIARNFIKTVELLLLFNSPLPHDILLTVIWEGSTLEMVKCLIDGGANACSITCGGDTVLHLALSGCYAKQTCHKLVKNLIEAGCDTTARNSAGETALETAIQHNLTSVVELLLPSNVPLPSNILLIAVWQGWTLEIIESLIHRGADVFAVCGQDTVLHLILITSHYPEETCCKLVKALIDAGCDTTACDSTGKPALEIAMQRSFTSVVELLLPFNAPLPPDILLIALQQGFTLEIVEYLVQRGADVHLITSGGDTPLHLALSRYYAEETCFKLVKILINAGCDPIVRNSTGQTGLDIAMGRDFTFVIELLLCSSAPIPLDILLIALQQGFTLEIVEYLVQRGADVHLITSGGDTPLHLALSRYYAEETCFQLVKILVNAGCDPIVRDSTGKTALDIALERGFAYVIEFLLCSDAPLPPDALLIALWHRLPLEMVEYLISRAVDVHSATSRGDTALHLALTRYYYTKERCFKLVKILINAGCDTTAHNFAGKTAVEIAMRDGFTSVVELLLPSNVPLPSHILLIAVQQGSPLEMVEYLIQRGADLHPTTSDGDTVLHLALRTSGYPKLMCHAVVKRLISAGCDPTVRNLTGNTALEIAMQHDLPPVIELLLPDVPLSPDILLIAVWQGWTLDVVQHLIKGGANVHSTTPNGDSVLHLALSWNYGEETCCKLVQCLTKSGCDPSACNSKGNTVLLAAIDCGYSSVVELLLSFNVPVPPDILHTALWRQSKPRIIYVLACKCDYYSLLEGVSLDWNTLLQLACTAYSGQYSRHVTETLESAQKACRTRPSLGDET